MSSSLIYPRETIIDDSTPERLWHPKALGFGAGLVVPENIGYGAAVSDFPQSLLIARSEWQSRIAYREAQKRQLSWYIRTYGMKSLNQEQTEFCFANAPTNLCRILNMLANQPYVDLSAASVACLVTNFQNHGENAANVLEFISTIGIVPSEYWPTNAIDRRYNTKANWEKAKPFIIDKWWCLEPRNMDQLVSLLLQDIPVAVAFNWWGHEVTAVDAVWLDGSVAIRCWNSWGDSYGDNGFFILQGNRMYPDDSIAAWSFAPGLAV